MLALKDHLSTFEWMSTLEICVGTDKDRMFRTGCDVIIKLTYIGRYEGVYDLPGGVYDIS